CMQGLDFPHSF
nr:immunoglobulin light chain junction region [Macaca mulatta]